MKVKELIKQLKKMDPDATVIAQTHNTMEQGQENVELKSANEGIFKLHNLHCRDAFDGINYTTQVYRRTDEKDKDKIGCVLFWA
jgi:hypothetical protein